VKGENAMLKDIVVLLAAAILSRISRIYTEYDIRFTRYEIRILATDEALSAINETPVVAY